VFSAPLVFPGDQYPHFRPAFAAGLPSCTRNGAERYFVRAAQSDSAGHRRPVRAGSRPDLRPRAGVSSGYELEEPSWVRARVVFAALMRIRATAPMITRSSSIWRLTIIRDVSVLGVMSPNPTVEKTVIVK
jgi:hypothetical protein